MQLARQGKYSLENPKAEEAGRNMPPELNVSVELELPRVGSPYDKTFLEDPGQATLFGLHFSNGNQDQR